MMFRPSWLKVIPNHLKPGREEVEKLEQLRAQFNIPHELFGMRVLGSPSTTIKAQRCSYDRFKKKTPRASEKELLRMILEERLQTPPVTKMSSEEIEEAIKRINSFKDLCDYVIALDEQEPATPDPLEIGKRIDEILEIAERPEIKEELKQKNFFDLGFQATENKNYKEAIKYYSKAIEDENELKSDAHYNLAICFLNQKNYGLAAEHYTVFCTREPQEATSDLLEHIEILRSASMLSPEEGYKLVEEYNKKTINQLSALDLKDSKISINDFLDKLNILLQMEIINAKEPFDKIIKNESAKIPLKVYSVPALKDSDPNDAFGFCDAFIRYGAAVSIILFDILEKRRITIKDPPYEKSYSKSEVSKRCPGNWLFIKTILDTVVEIQAQNFLAKKPWVGDCMDLIKESIIREFVYEGFSIGLESGGY